MSFLNNTFLVLFLLAIIILVVGFIKPSLIGMKSRKAAITRGALLFVVSFILFGLTMPDEKEEVSEPDEEQLLNEEKEKKEAERLEAEKAKELEEQKKLEEQQALEEQQKKEEEEERLRLAEEEQKKADEKAAQKAQEEAANPPTEVEETPPTQDISFKNCTEMRKVYPNGVPSTHPAYDSKHDRDGDNTACEQ